MSNSSKVAKILIIHLKATFKGQPFVNTEVHNVALEDELSYTLAIGPLTNLATKQVIKKSETNEIKYIQVYSNTDGKTYWYFDTYVYAEVQESQSVEDFQKYWINEIQLRAMEELKAQNQMIKGMHRGIESLVG